MSQSMPFYDIDDELVRARWQRIGREEGLASDSQIANFLIQQYETYVHPCCIWCHTPLLLQCPKCQTPTVQTNVNNKSTSPPQCQLLDSCEKQHGGPPIQFPCTAEKVNLQDSFAESQRSSDRNEVKSDTDVSSCDGEVLPPSALSSFSLPGPDGPGNENEDNGVDDLSAIAAFLRSVNGSEENGVRSKSTEDDSASLFNPESPRGHGNSLLNPSSPRSPCGHAGSMATGASGSQRVNLKNSSDIIGSGEKVKNVDIVNSPILFLSLPCSDDFENELENDSEDLCNPFSPVAPFTQVSGGDRRVKLVNTSFERQNRNGTEVASSDIVKEKALLFDDENLSRKARGFDARDAENVCDQLPSSVPFLDSNDRGKESDNHDETLPAISVFLKDADQNRKDKIGRLETDRATDLSLMDQINQSNSFSLPRLSDSDPENESILKSKVNSLPVNDFVTSYAQSYDRVSRCLKSIAIHDRGSEQTTCKQGNTEIVGSCNPYALSTPMSEGNSRVKAKLGSKVQPTECQLVILSSSMKINPCTPTSPSNQLSGGCRGGKWVDRKQKKGLAHQSRNVCTICDAPFPDRGALKKHKLVCHPGDRPFKCSVCHSTFKMKKHLTCHKLTHSNEKSFLCTECGESFLYENTLKVHMRTHTKEKPYTCKVCDFSCSQLSNLRNHECIHTDHRPFKCQTCFKGFKSMPALKRHTVHHGDSRPFTCETCNAAFKSKERLRAHQNAVHKTGSSANKNLTCSQCSFTTHLRDRLRQHVLSHSTERPFKCEICLKCFRRRYHLDRHHQQCHSEDKI